MAQGYAISVSDLSLSFGATPILSNIHFNLHQGSRAALIGANGVGKTTLLRVIAGQLMPDSGNVNLARAATIGLLCQQDEALEQGTVYEVALKSFEPAFHVERQMRQLEEQINQTTDEPLLLQYAEELANLQSRFESLRGYMAQSLCAGTLQGLGFTRDQFDQDVTTLSGGQRRRLALCQLLLIEPSILLLDEPTNHLDLSAMQFLEDTLKVYPGTVLCVSHDRWFIDRLCQIVIELSFGLATTYKGNFTSYVEQAADVYEKQAKAYALQQKEIARQKAIIARYRAFNREKSIRAAESRQRMLNKIERLDQVQEEQTLKMSLPPPPPMGQIALRAQALSKAFGKRLFDQLDLTIHNGERIAIVGPNGCGKTTLLRILCGRLAADQGFVTPGAGLRIGWFDQLQSTLSKQGSLLDDLRSTFPQMGDQKLRTLLGAFLFPGEDALEDISILSGGERARLMLLKLILDQANLLALDEPTNHLDMPSRTTLEEALISWGGTLLFVSHDRFFIDQIATRILSFEEDGIWDISGNWQDYLMEKEKHNQKINSFTPINKTQRREDLRKQRKEVLHRKQTKQQIAELECQIAALEEAVKQMETTMQDPSLYTDVDATKALMKRYADAQKEIEEKTHLWLSLHEE